MLHQQIFALLRSLWENCLELLRQLAILLGNFSKNLQKLLGELRSSCRCRWRQTTTKLVVGGEWRTSLISLRCLGSILTTGLASAALVPLVSVPGIPWLLLTPCHQLCGTVSRCRVVSFQKVDSLLKSKWLGGWYRMEFPSDRVHQAPCSCSPLALAAMPRRRKHSYGCEFTKNSGVNKAILPRCSLNPFWNLNKINPFSNQKKEKNKLFFRDKKMFLSILAYHHWTTFGSAC